MKRILYIALCAVILSLGYRMFFSSTAGTNADYSGRIIICFGDSLTYGTGAGDGMDYPSQLSQMIGQPVINAGVPGDTTARALQRLEQDVLVESPDLVLITLGGNDLKNGVAKDRGFGRAYQELADETGVILIPNIFAGIMGNRKLMSDPIHPNDDGYKIMAEKFHEAMSQL